MNKFSHIILLLFTLLAFSASDTLARLDGEVAWGYSHYEQSSGANDKQATSSFTQRYSVLYGTEGLLGAGRVGAYNLSVGAEWAAFDSDLDGTSLSKDSAKLLYNGRVQIAPGGLPFRLDAYSQDMSKTGFERSTFGSFMRTGVVTDLYNGQTIVTGVRFAAGIRNGSYLGEYREMMSKWPRLLMDYRETYHRDMDARVPVEHRTRNLAFVSLNKKSNWFHYRVNEYTDYMNPVNDSTETVYLLGTIDHLLRRNWIDMTNWIRLSVDGSLTQSKERNDSRATDAYNVNFFTTMRYDGFNASSFLNLQRTKRGSGLYQSLDVPVYINKRINPDSNFRSTFEFWQDKDLDLNSNYDRARKAYYGKALLETNRRGTVTVVPSLEAEIYSADMSDGEAVRGRVEVYSKLLRQRVLSWQAMGSLARFSGEANQNEAVSLWEGELSARASYAPGSRMRFIGDQYFLYGTGDNQASVTHFMGAKSSGGFGNQSGANASYGEGSLFRSTTSLSFEYSTRARLKNRFEMNYNYQKTDDSYLDNVKLTHRLDYQSRGWRFELHNLYTRGDDVTSTAPPTNATGGSFSPTSIEEQFSHRGIVRYNPNSYWESRLEAQLFWGNDSSGQKTQTYSVRQSLKRSFYSFSGIRRQRGTFTQSLMYENYDATNAREAIVFSLAGEYFPTTYWRLGTRMSYYYNNFASNSIYYSLTTGLDFSLFNADFSYNYGAREENDVVAHRYEVNIRKTF